jgi:hypothetical protein
MNSKELDELIWDVTDVGERIKAVDNLIRTIEDEELRKTYNQDILQLISYYKDLTIALEKELQVFIREEKKGSGPITFKYRKILASLKK